MGGFAQRRPGYQLELRQAAREPAFLRETGPSSGVGRLLRWPGRLHPRLAGRRQGSTWASTARCTPPGSITSTTWRPSLAMLGVERHRRGRSEPGYGCDEATTAPI